jgi:hypothetical protein
MIISRLTGGLGNQLFQYAFGRELAERHHTQLKLDLSCFSNERFNVPVRTYALDIFNIKAEKATPDEIFRLSQRTRFDIPDRVLNRLLGVKKSHIREPHTNFSSAAFESPDNVYISGYWQSEKYFADVVPLLRQELTLKDPPAETARPILDRIESTNSIGVHVRRGDFLTNPTNGIHGVDYFKRAERILSEKFADRTYFVFSDDLDWCQGNLAFDGPTIFVTEDFGENKLRDDFRLMASCKNFIIPNSSFSWWAAWLAPNPDKTVIAPRRWLADASMDTSDVVPRDWVRV